jgi:serine/threonine-protein kinase
VNVEVEIGSMVSNYRVERLLGSGAMGTVYLAHDVHLERPVALKLLAAELARDERFRERFLRESRTAARLEHPAIVPIYAAGEAEGTLFLAMRYVEGSDLRDIIKRQGPLDPDRVVAIVSQVAEGLDAAHEAGLVHRDVKPGNILVDPSGRAYLCDFGLAKHSSTVNSLTRDTAFVGTIDYIAPEQIQGGSVDGRADEYALGCVLYEALTGLPPFRRDSDLAVVFAHLKEPPPLPTASRPELPEGIDAVVARALAKHAPQRYASCAELARDAAVGLAGGEVDAPPPRELAHAFLITDVRGYTRFTQQHGDDAAAQLSERFIRLATVQIQQFDGRVMATHGDEVVSVFESPRRALRAALGIQAAVVADGFPLGVGVGLDAGEAVEVGDDYHGGALNIAARLCSAAGGGEVLASEPLVHLARRVEGIAYLEGRIERLKGIEQPVKVVEVVPAERGDSLTRRIRRRMRGRRWGRAAVAAGAVIGALAGVVVLQIRSDNGPAPIGSHPNTIAAFDTTTHKLVGEVHLGSPPGDLRSYAGSIWTMTNGGTLNRIDPQKLKVTNSLAVGGDAWTTGDGSIWAIATDDPKTLIRIDPDYLTKSTVRLRTTTLETGWPDAVWIDFGGGLMWVAGNAHVEAFNPANGRLVHSYPIVGAWIARFADGALYVASSPTGLIRKVDPNTGRVLWKTRLQPWINDIQVSGGSVWALVGADATVHQLATSDGQDLATIPTGAPNGDPQAIVPGDGSLWVDNSRSGTVARIDPVDPRRRPQSFPTGHAGAGMVEQDGRLFVGLFAGPADDLKGVTGDVVKVGMREDWLNQPDPALAWSHELWQLEYATLAKLYNYPDRSGTTGATVVPELATAMPEFSAGGRTVRITVRDGYRFSPPSGETVTAETVRRSIERALSPGISPQPPGSLYLTGLMGEDAFRAGKADHISGISVQDGTLTFQFTTPKPDLASVLALPFFGVVPSDTPRAQIDTAPPTAGPYYVTKHNWYVVVKRNPNYGGDRPQRVDAMTFEIDVATGTAASRVAAGTLDMVAEQLTDAGALSGDGQIARQYGAAQAGKPRWQVMPTNDLSFFMLNITRPPFADLSIRKAAAYAVDRRALAAADEAVPVDGYLPPDMPGVSSGHVYPVDGPDLTKARALMHGRTATAVLAACASGICREQAQILQRNLAAIGIRLHIHQMDSVYDAPLNSWDMSAREWSPDEYDPSGIIATPMFESDVGVNPTGYGPAPLRRALDRAQAASGKRRSELFGALERRILRTSLPWISFQESTAPVFTSARLGCVIASPVYFGVNLAALCMR